VNRHSPGCRHCPGGRGAHPGPSHFSENGRGTCSPFRKEVGRCPREARNIPFRFPVPVRFLPLLPPQPGDWGTGGADRLLLTLGEDQGVIGSGAVVKRPNEEAPAVAVGGTGEGKDGGTRWDSGADFRRGKNSVDETGAGAGGGLLSANRGKAKRRGRLRGFVFSEDSLGCVWPMGECQRAKRIGGLSILILPRDSQLQSQEG
jgi:hypothetical protein